ncbi:hypothetical protein SODALDRAFT_362034 [Sodiomyces alkalinus F11]|uniref:Uncharacterized protein n=1 Tax=Sodiomyces alkalinus (strain CBS 110278 / VKM F-3762 / F11) TaxID=1314773 RepID=A0A3N2PP14_SODAK|nr:hypothetical protein SODALDRAFT_362034 [Sodiomyces alkalinus F11]ROT36252.1 hypothetical protein SODALDRAFT_362034 [Sodiomyces alkalinus F11]
MALGLLGMGSEKRHWNVSLLNGRVAGAQTSIKLRCTLQVQEKKKKGDGGGRSRRQIELVFTKSPFVILVALPSETASDCTHLYPHVGASLNGPLGRSPVRLFQGLPLIIPVAFSSHPQPSPFAVSSLRDGSLNKQQGEALIPRVESTATGNRVALTCSFAFQFNDYLPSTQFNDTKTLPPESDDSALITTFISASWAYRKKQQHTVARNWRH